MRYGIVIGALFIGLGSVARAADEFPPGTPQTVIQASRRLKASQAAGKMPDMADIKVLQDWATGMAARNNVPRQGAHQTDSAEARVIEPRKCRIEIDYQYIGTTETTKSKVSGKFWSDAIVYPMVRGYANYTKSAGDPNAKVSSFRIEPVMNSAGNDLVKSGGGRLTRTDEFQGGGSTSYVVDLEHATAAGMLMTTGVKDQLWPHLEFDARAKGTVTHRDDNGTRTAAYDDQLKKLSALPIPLVADNRAEQEDGFRTGQFPVPVAKFSLKSMTSAVEKGYPIIAVAAPIDLTDGGIRYVGLAKVSLQMESGCDGEPSGAHWCAKYPDVKLLDELQEPFKTNAKAFVRELEGAGANVSIGSVIRPVERAYLMHFAWEISRKGFDPRSVPKLDEDEYNDARRQLIAKGTPEALVPPFRAPVEICWAHGGKGPAFNREESKAAAEAMVQGYHMAHWAAFPVGRHMQHLAMDITITWNGTIRVPKRDGTLVALSANGGDAMKQKLWAVGASYGVKKHPTDPPHWSVDGS